MTYLAENRKEYGYYHLSNDAEGDTTWYDFAVAVSYTHLDVYKRQLE